tara:strand:- start:1020 stop:1232 length:213 start_codon:yes stop_codon:yes gene_type:complete
MTFISSLSKQRFSVLIRHALPKTNPQGSKFLPSVHYAKRDNKGVGLGLFKTIDCKCHYIYPSGMTGLDFN